MVHGMAVSLWQRKKTQVIHNFDLKCIEWNLCYIK